jgi:hypothetical protein
MNAWWVPIGLVAWPGVSLANVSSSASGFDEIVGVTGKASQYVVSHSLTKNQRQKRRVRIRRGQ